ncbi:hypothetical protein [Symbiopectobacterium sp. RP]
MNKKTQAVPTSLPAQAYQLGGQLCFALYSANLAMNIAKPLNFDYII